MRERWSPGDDDCDFVKRKPDKDPPFPRPDFVWLDACVGQYIAT